MDRLQVNRHRHPLVNREGVGNFVFVSPIGGCADGIMLGIIRKLVALPSRRKLETAAHARSAA